MAERRAGRFRLWACALFERLEQVVVGAGLEPATLDFRSRCSTRLSYPVVDEPDSNRRPTARAAALPLSYRPLAKHRLALPGMRHGRAARTGRMRRSSRESAPLWSVRRCFALAPRRRRQFVCGCPARHPCRSIQARRKCASGGIPCFGPARPDASGRDALAFDRGLDPLRTPETKNPRAFRTRGHSRRLGRSG